MIRNLTAEWSRHIEELANGMLYTQVDFLDGINSNVKGRNVGRTGMLRRGCRQRLHWRGAGS